MMKKKTLAAADGKRWSLPAINTVLVAVVLIVPPFFLLLGGGIGPGTAASWIKTAVAGMRHGSDDVSFLHRRTARGKLLGGLLADGFDQESCHSRYQSAAYRRNAGRQPSRYLVSKLRSHEALQRRCGPGTAAYADALDQLRSGKSVVASPGECSYLVSISYRGLGNRILAVASAFLYAVLTGRVLLVDPSNAMDELFCEPFPGTTWLLPPGFPIVSYQSFHLHTAERYGRMREDGVLRTGGDVVVNGSSSAVEEQQQLLPAFAYVHLDYNQTDSDQLFFCDEDQRLMSNIRWLLMRTDSYIVPGLFLVESFAAELVALFPESDAVFHHLGRYLLHPTNHVWGLVTRYHRAHLAWARRVVGIQVRVFPWWSESPEILEKITTCTQKEGLLPAVLGEEEPATTLPSSTTTTAPGARPVAVLITSLKAWYYDMLKGMYWERTTASGEAVVVDQPSHEEFQRYKERSHEQKAWAEVYLLSTADALVTTGASTFGYVAQGLGGLRPWVLDMEMNGTRPPCIRDVSMDPCFHVAPLHGCSKRREAVDAGEIVPHVRHCEDLPTGLKLVHR